MIRQSRPTLLLTRPMAQSQRFARELGARFGAMPCVMSPLLAPQFLTPPFVERQVIAAVFTSETGVLGAVQARIQGLPTAAYCVGARTAKTALAAGFAAISADGDWQDLARLIIARHTGGDLAFFCAEEAGDHLAQHLQRAGITLHRCDVYRQQPLPLSRAAVDLLAASGPVVLPLFSPRSAQVFCAAVPQPVAPLWLAALSPAVAGAFTLNTVQQVVAHRPDSAALLDAIAILLEMPPKAAPLP